MDKSLYERLMEYGASDVYPFHMPGHKRQTEAGGPTDMGNPYVLDVTEIDWNDNLHHAEGILKTSMETAAGIYGASRSFFLVNGSTCGILSAVAAAVPFGGKILMARNCHRSAYHAVIQNHLDVEYVYPQNLHKFGVYGGLLSEDIREIVDKCPGICAVFLTSPTYEGIVSDIGEIARMLHGKGIPLIVDEAHGAHFPFGEEFPRSAVDCGADLVIQSLHKTLPALTQTAILHVNGDRIDRGRLERYLRIYQTSSPSYVLMASIENCIRYMDGPGRRRMDVFGRRVRRLTGELQGLSCLRVMDDSVIGSKGVYDRDPSKLVIAAGGRSGTELAKVLRERYHLEMEMASAGHVLAMTSLMDSEDGLERLQKALREIDEEWAAKDIGRGDHAGAGHNEDDFADDDKQAAGRIGECCGEHGALWTRLRPEAGMPLWEAVDAPSETVELKTAAQEGRLAAEFVMVYPPGIPLLAPGEIVSEEALRVIETYHEKGCSFEGLSGEHEQLIAVVKG